MVDQREPTPEQASDAPDLDVCDLEDGGTVKMFEPETTGAYIIIDVYSVVHLGECA